MFVLGDEVCWSAADLTGAAECEYAVLRRLDVVLGRAPVVTVPEDPLSQRVARLGEQHEAAILQSIKEAEPAPTVVELGRASPPYTEGGLRALHAATLAAMAGPADVVVQAGFYDGELHGHADVLERTDAGWLVCDAKLARQARPTALLQLAVYADQLLAAGVRVAPRAALLLGGGRREEFPLGELLPVLHERRARLRGILAAHRAEGAAVAWGDDRYVACGRCVQCRDAVERHDDLLKVARLRLDQRKRLRAHGVQTLKQLAEATTPPRDLAADAFRELRAQAALQLSQEGRGLDAGGRPQVSFELTDLAAGTLALLPAPSPGDLFFDFEGDPLYHEGDLTRWGLEYLWGVMGAPAHDGAPGRFTPLWAHDSAQEKAAFETFMALIAERRSAHPDMHVYHYAPYETAALKRLAGRHQSCERELDDLLRSRTFVDLYAVVRAAVRVSQPSYSIKMLEPLYMGRDQLRSGDAVQAGDASIVEYHEYRHLTEVGDHAAAVERLRALAAYNESDCLSTLRLRDWLLARARDCGVDSAVEATVVDRGSPRDADMDEEHEAAGLALLARAGPGDRSERTAEQQAYAMLAASTGYFRRERLPFWWAHFDRLATPLADWGEPRDVFRIAAVTVEQDWALPEGRPNTSRRLRLTGQWGPGSTPGDQAMPVYAAPPPPGVRLPEKCRLGAGGAHTIELVEGDDTAVVLTETAKPGQTHRQLPVALVPAPPPWTGAIETAVREVAAEAATAPALPQRAAVDLLLRRPPRLRSGATLPASGNPVADVVSAVLALDSSYVAVQGPPGTGKTHTGSRVVRRLVEEHGWRVGVVGQSHRVVENLLAGIVAAGLDPDLVGKSNNESAEVTWTRIGDQGPKRRQFLEERRGSGCVLGGTAWTFSAPGSVPRAELDLLVIDEAGQLALPPTIGASVAAERLLLLGDPQQLPQVSQGTHPEPVGRSALGWLLDGHDTIPGRLGYFLPTTHRMHPALCDKVSTLAYDGRLRSEPCTAERSLAGVAPGLRVVTVPHTDNRTESAEEAAEVVRQVGALVGTRWLAPEVSATPRPLADRDVLVVAPYNAQVTLLRRELGEAGFGGVRVGTVDRFQGQEAAVVIVSMTASSHGDVPRGMGFLLSRNRVNVAVSRAQWLAVLVRSDALTSYVPRTPHRLLELGAFLRLCRPADGLRSTMTESADADRVQTRADLLPEELAAGSADPEEQAKVILEDSDDRTDHPEETRRSSTQTPG